LVRRANRRRLAKHQLLVREGDPADAVYLLADGALTLWRDRRDGDRQVTGFLYPGDAFGVASGGRHVCSACASVPAQVFALDRGEFERLCESDPDVRHCIFHGALNDLAAVQDQLVLLGCKTPMERVGTFLLQLDRRRPAHRGPGDGVLWLPMRRTDIASYLGLHLGTLSRTFGELRRSGVIAVESTTTVTIRDPIRLAQLSEPA
jgi:CRP/FNR family transcriptional regulator